MLGSQTAKNPIELETGQMMRHTGRVCKHLVLVIWSDGDFIVSTSKGQCYFRAAFFVRGSEDLWRAKCCFLDNC